MVLILDERPSLGTSYSILSAIGSDNLCIFGQKPVLFCKYEYIIYKHVKSTMSCTECTVS